MKLPLPCWTEPLRRTLPPGRVFVVGGFVRDTLAGQQPHDLDVAGPLQPEALSKLPGWEHVRMKPRDTALGTVCLVWEHGGKQYEAEYTAFRRESYPPGGYHRPQDVRFGVSLEQDALRRDFRVNAIYADLSDGNLQDPLGGLEDLRARVLHTTRSPYDVFSDDGLRLLRLFRTAAELEFSATEETWAGALEWNHLLADISPDRLYAELTRLLLADTRFPEKAYTVHPLFRALSLLGEAGCCPVLGMGHPPSEDTLTRCTYLPPRLPLRLAGWLAEEPPESIPGLLNRLRLPKQLIQRVASLCRLRDWDIDGALPEDALRLGLMGMGYALAEDWTALRGASDSSPRWRETLNTLRLANLPESPMQLELTGGDLLALGIAPGPAMGKIKQRLWEWVILHPKEADRASLLRQAERMLQNAL